MHMARTENAVVVTTAIAGADRLSADRPRWARPRRKGGCHGVVKDAVTAVRLQAGVAVDGALLTVNGDLVGIGLAVAVEIGVDGAARRLGAQRSWLSAGNGDHGDADDEAHAALLEANAIA